jgi:hypothetical protein
MISHYGTGWARTGQGWPGKLRFPLFGQSLAFICLCVDCERTGLAQVYPGMALVDHRQDWLQLVVIGRNGQMEWTGNARTGEGSVRLPMISLKWLLTVGGKMKKSHRYSFRPFRLTSVFSLDLFFWGFRWCILILMLTVCINIYSCALPSHCNNITEDVGNIYFSVYC